MAGGRDPDWYYRISKALHLVTREAIPCVDKCLSTWHANQALPSCTGQCPVGKKPKSPAACQACVAWGQSVEGALCQYQPPAAGLQPAAGTGKPQINWPNVNPSNLGKSHVEVAKAFVLRLPHKSGSGFNYNHISDFDSASLLMIMAKFTLFLHGTKSSYDTIMKVAEIRNELAHMRLNKDMQLDDQKVKQHFQDIEDLVTCLETLHPHDFNTDRMVKQRLTEIQSEPITDTMRKEMMFDLSRKVDDLADLPRKVDDLADLPRKVDDLVDLPRKVNDLADISRKVDVLADLPRKVDDLADLPRKMDDLADLPRKMDVMADLPRKMDDLAELPRKMDDLADLPRKMDDLADLPRKMDDLAESPRKMDDLADLPRKMDDLADLPRKMDDLADLPRKMDDLAELPRKMDDLAELPRKMDDLAELPRKIDDLAELPRKVDDLADLMSKAVLRSEINHESDEKILHNFQEELRLHYFNSLCKIPLFPGDYDSIVDLQDMYTNLALEINLPQPCSPIKMPLASYDEMFTRKTPEGYFHTKLLVSASAGLGKTTLSAKISYDWATRMERSPLGDIKLLIVLNMRYIDSSSNLEDAILNQLLAENTSMTSSQIRRMIERNAENAIIILDAIDESDRELYGQVANGGDIVKLLRGRHLTNCRLLVTTRPWRIKEVKRMCQATFTQVELKGFDKTRVKQYIKKFFKHDETLAQSLIEYLQQHPLAAELVYVPLMALLVCTYWNVFRDKDPPSRIGQLYNAIINVMHRHYSEKNRHMDTSCSAGQEDDVTELVEKMGKLALKGFWPPENRIVFTLEEAESPGDVDTACRIGLISKQEVSISGMLALRNQKQTVLTFFHKTCGEKCAGEYLGSLADEDPEELSSKLSALKTVQDALSVQLILQFACGANITVASEIILRLMIIYQIEVKSKMSQYTDGTLKWEDMQTVHEFIDLCLRCNYEAGGERRFKSLLKDLFPDGNIFFFGISSLTAVALGYYLQHSEPEHINNIALTQSGDPTRKFSYKLHMPSSDLGFYPILRRVSKIPLGILHSTTSEYVAKLPNMNKAYARLVSSQPATLLAHIKMWQACERLPTMKESNIAPVIDSLRYTHLQVFDIYGFDIGKTNIDSLLLVIEKGYLSRLLQLRVACIGMDGNQTDRMAMGVKEMPHLKTLHMAQNESHRSLSILGESMSSITSIELVDVCDLDTSVEDVTQFAQRFYLYGWHLLELWMSGNPMDDNVASLLTLHLHVADLLRKFSISVHNFSMTRHNQLLSAMSVLSRLETLAVHDSQYPDDLMMCVADLIPQLPNLSELRLGTHQCSAPQVSSSAGRKFNSSLQVICRRRLFLNLKHIALEKDDFIELVSLCRKIKVSHLGYFSTCLPDGVSKPQDDFVVLF